MGGHLKARLEALHAKSSVISEVRGEGLLVGVEFAKPIAKDLVKAMLARGILANATSDTVMRCAPPLIIAEKDIDAFTDALGDCLSLNPSLKSGTC